jgi:hypothetical protein
MIPTEARKPVRLTQKELQRASGRYTLIVRPQTDGSMLVAPVIIEDGHGIILETYAEVTDRSRTVAATVAEVMRWMDKMGFPCPMAEASRHRG